jgi:hypothetical protein
MGGWWIGIESGRADDDEAAEEREVTTVDKSSICSPDVAEQSRTEQTDMK